MKVRILLLLVLLGFQACRDFDPLDGVTITIDYNLFETFVSFRFVDASTGQLIGSTDGTQVISNFSGEHHEAVLTQVGERALDLPSVFGLASIALNPFEPYSPDSSQAIFFNINTTCPGYQDASFSVAVRDTGYHTHHLLLQPTTQTPGRHSSKLELNDFEEGELKEEIIIQASAQSLSLQLPKGLKISGTIGEEEALLVEINQFESVKRSPLGDQKIFTFKEEQEFSERAFDIRSLTQISFKNAKTGEALNFEGNQLPILSFELPQSGGNAVPEIWMNNEATHYWEALEIESWACTDSICKAQLILPHLSYYALGHTQNTKVIEVDIKFSFENDFIAETFGAIARVSLLETGEKLHDIPFELSEGLVHLSFLAPIDQAIALRFYASHGDFEFQATPGSISIDPDATTNLAEVSVKALKCRFAGSLNIQTLPGFREDLIPIQLRINDAETGSRYATLNHQLNPEGEVIAFSWMVKSDRPLSCSLHARSLAATFDSSEPINMDSGCNQDINLDFEIQNTSCLLQGQINLNPLGAVPERFIRMKVVRTSDRALVHNRVIDLDRYPHIYPFSLGVPENTGVSLIFEQNEAGGGVLFQPAEISIENACAGFQTHELQFSSNRIAFGGEISFSFDSELEANTFPLKYTILDWISEEELAGKSFEIDRNNPSFNIQELLEDKPVKIKITRNQPSELFITEPFIIEVPKPTQITEKWDIGLIKTRKELVHAKLKVICPGGEILPTVQGYYRIPGEAWKELFIIVGNLVIMAEKYATYEVGMILDGKMTDSTFTVNSNQIEMNFELDQADCEKMGWGK